MTSRRPSQDSMKKTARYRATSSLILLLLLLLASPSPPPSAWAAEKHPAKAPAKEKQKTTPNRTISFDYSMRANGRNEFLVLGDGPMKNYKTLLLANPSRLVLDIPNVILPGNTVELPVNQPELSRIRIARHPDKVRFVFDLPEGKEVRNKVITQDKGLKVLLSLSGTTAAPEGQNPAGKKPAPSGRQLKTLAFADLEEIFGSQQVSVVFHKTPIREFAKYLSEKSGRRIEVSPELAISVSLKLTEVPLHTLVKAAAETIGFVLKQDGDRIILHPADPQPPASGQKNGETS